MIAKRTVLGRADVSDEQLATMVAASLGTRRAQLVASHAEIFPYDLEAITTGGRFSVRGTARADGSAECPYAFFVKVIQSWPRSPLFQQAPEQVREAAHLVPWRTEPDVYRSELRDRLPAGLTMPRAFAVVDLDEESAAVWLEWISARDIGWARERYERAAYLLGRLAASPSVAPLAAAVAEGRTARNYANIWLAQVVLPALNSDELWVHPLVTAAFDDELRRRLLAAADALPSFLDELDGIPFGTAHGDACTRNLLVTGANDSFTMIDFGFWGRAQLGFDLGQLLLGEVQLGERPAGTLTQLEAACLPAYVRGLRAEGSAATQTQVRRSQALLMLIFSGLAAIPFEHLAAEPTAQLHRIASERAASARFILGLVEATNPRTAASSSRASW